MNHQRFILALAISLTGCQPLSNQQLAPAAPPVVISPYPVTTVPVGPVLAGPPYLQTPPVIQPAPEILPVYPPQSTVVPLPSQTPGSIFGPPLVAAPAGTVPAPPASPASPLVQIAPGGMVSPQLGLPAGPEAAVGPGNPIAVPVVDEELAWDQIVDVVSDYFPIAREERARRSADAVVEGRIETAAPQSGATWLEPHRRDAVGSFNRWENTFQTIRRRAVIRVIPDAAGYLVEVVVEKEREDLPQPEHATAGSATFRNDGSLPSRRLEQVSLTRSSPRWISLGRDAPLEQRMLADIHARLNGVNIGSGSIFSH